MIPAFKILWISFLVNRKLYVSIIHASCFFFMFKILISTTIVVILIFASDKLFSHREIYYEGVTSIPSENVHFVVNYQISDDGCSDCRLMIG